MEIEDPENLELVESDQEEEVVEVASDNDPDATAEEEHLTFDKKTGEAVEISEVLWVSAEGAGAEGEGGDEVVGGGEEVNLFEEEKAEGLGFLNVKPWIGTVVEPSDHPAPDRSPPDVDYKLEYVFGYRAEDTRNNVFYNAEGNVAYFTACLGVILNKEDNTQTFFGGNEVANAAKQAAIDKDNHTNDIMSMDVSLDGTLAVSGQNGSQPTVFVWDAVTGEKIKRFVLPKGSREVSAIGFSVDNKYIATVDNHNDHYVRVYAVKSGDLVFEQKSGGEKVFDLEWSKKEGHYEFSTAGTKHFMTWRPLEGLGKNGIYGGKAKMTSHACVTYDEKGTAYSGGANSYIHCWRNRQLAKAYKVHDSGFVGAIKVFEDKIYSGGKDGSIIVSNPNNGSIERTVQVGSLIRAIDFRDGNILVGDFDGRIMEVSPDDEVRTLMNSHSEGETWGLDLLDDGRIITSGDDNKVMVWSLDERRLVAQAIVSERNEKSKIGGASSLSKQPPSKCSRAVAVNNGSGSQVSSHHRFSFINFFNIFTVASSVLTILCRGQVDTDMSQLLQTLVQSPSDLQLTTLKTLSSR